ncbi:MAG: hypothetical protein U0793_06880 [Gemmataceae bacterium]
MEHASNIFTQTVHLILVWIGFGTLVGLLAKAVIPGKDPGGALATVVIGILGSIIGAGVLVFFSDSLRVSPISPLGFIVAIGGTSLLLLVYRLLHGKGHRFNLWPFGRGGRPRRHVTVVED